MTVQLALFKGKGIIGNALIRWWTGSIYSHCEIVVDGWCYSSSLMDKGVRRKRVGLEEHEISLSSDKWDIIDLPLADAEHVLKYFAETDSHSYGWLSLIKSQIFNRNMSDYYAKFCSAWCGYAIKLPVPESYSPATLGIAALWAVKEGVR